ncbi:TPA: hypothetical protein ACOFCQ_003249 [Stenotrophomonas maltophilia]
MKWFLPGVFLLFATVAGCATSGQAPPSNPAALLPSKAIKGSAELDGSQVELRGYLVAQFEDRGIWDSKAEYRRYNSEASCVSLLIPKRMIDQVERRSGAYATIRGKLIGDLRSRGTVLLGGCNVVAIEVQELGEN